MSLYTAVSLGSRLVNGNTRLPMKDIDITVDTVDTVDTVGKRWPGIGTNNDPYNGRFNGNGHTVTLMDADASTAANRRSQPTP